MQELGKIQIYFGKVKSVSDPDFICRCQIQIPGVTDELPVTDLPWYYPWYGRHWLPEIDDTVTVIIFDNNMITGFYGNKIDLISAGVSEGDYPNYLEIFKRTISGNEVELVYKESTGIEFVNGQSKAQIELDKYSMFVSSNSVVITENRIDIGNSGLEPAVLGNKNAEILQKIIDDNKQMRSMISQMFDLISSACTNAFTLPIKGAISGFNPKLKSTNSSLHSAESNKVEPTKSKMVFVNK